MRLGSFLAISFLLLLVWAESVLLYQAGGILVHLLLMMAVFFFVGHLVRNTSLV
ncbi:MAG TPA: hypothetical protein VND65_13700 [Candidatus Binatia bacterium]|nr:hypothetical protein [Candidatus Binatia bacterium]